MLTDEVELAEAAKAAAQATLDATNQDIASAQESVTNNNLKVDDNAAYLELSAEDQAKMDTNLDNA